MAILGQTSNSGRSTFSPVTREGERLSENDRRFSHLFFRGAPRELRSRGAPFFLVYKKRLLKFPHLRIFFDFFLLDLDNQSDSALAWLRHFVELEKKIIKGLRSVSLNRSPS
jgi:hypothetical protein